MPSFDIVSKTDLAEVRNAVEGVVREIQTRFDFKGSKSSVELKEGTITLLADDDLKLKQVHELLKTYFVRRKLDTGALEFGKEEKATGNMVRQVVTVKQGIDKDLAKRLVKEIKDSKLKVQAAIQGDELRVTGKKIDDYVVTWVNQYGKTRVFCTTLGHNTDTVADPRYLDLVTRGLLWSVGKLDGKDKEKYLKPAPAAAPAKVEPQPTPAKKK